MYAATDAYLGIGLQRTDESILKVAIRSQTGSVCTPCIETTEATIRISGRLQPAPLTGECKAVDTHGRPSIQRRKYQDATVQLKLATVSSTATQLVGADAATALKGIPPNSTPIITATAFAGPPHLETHRKCTLNSLCGSRPWFGREALCRNTAGTISRSTKEAQRT